MKIEREFFSRSATVTCTVTIKDASFFAEGFPTGLGLERVSPSLNLPVAVVPSLHLPLAPDHLDHLDHDHEHEGEVHLEV